MGLRLFDGRVAPRNYCMVDIWLPVISDR